ncbi:response regulator [Candidatus Falkowbacteria bacterium CG10_big_fil_rev_8_21_14_0_10_44_15]|uniref:Response regulator n=1 Tax=Candidatus Falkowbacteria bacterium CG10_big_fil_rev_8_21_14_0_10_44_15 TaxID=1974569 RepID=A0A2H0UZW6_9BACT|nr:MAG: response regulator [Candidatus Falkowbacteria bacterium CG10_big_fil_rev_8_21_14_0_10_44_15]
MSYSYLKLLIKIHMGSINKKILIVEDEALMLRSLSDKFREEKFTVLEANDGANGLDSALANHPDIILLDIIMPKMDGLTVLEKLRQDEWGKEVPVIILTNLSDSDKVAEAMKNRAYDFLVKADWKLEDIVRKVNEKLAKD